MNSSSEVAQNLERAAVLINQSVEYGAALVALPENFALMPRHESDRMAVAEEPGHGPIQDFLAGQAKHHGIRLVGGTVPLMAAGEKKFHASCLFFGPDGRCLARYDKIHLFDVVVSDSEAYRESDFFTAGDAGTENQICVDTPQGRLGLTICYDVRFPELYRELSGRGAAIFTVPSAFTATTGGAHWEILLRARAIENLAYVIAPGQSGTHESGRVTFGHSMIIDPWGKILHRLTDEPEGVVIADIDQDRLKSIRRYFPSLRHRRL
jgi:nitrilase